LPQNNLIKWADKVSLEDVADAKNFLSLVYDAETMGELCEALLDAPVTQRRADDILRATCLEPLCLDDLGVLRVLRRILKGKKLKPVLIVKDKDGSCIANGYHKVSFAYRLNPDFLVNCAIATVGGDDETSN
jgi:hypothetical protein